MNENFILHVVQCVSDYFAPHVAKMQQILSESPHKHICMKLPPEGRQPLGHGIDSLLLQKLFSDIFTM